MSENLKQAEADLVATEEIRQQREKAVEDLKADMASTLAEVARLEALHELTAKEALAQENARRKMRRLEGELQSASEAVDFAADDVRAAERKRSIARLADVDVELTELDAAFLADVRASAHRFGKQRAVIFEKLREAHELNFSLRPGAAWTHRGALAGVPAETLPSLEAALETLERAAAMERQRAQRTPEMSA